jgi:hypothetical protein
MHIISHGGTPFVCNPFSHRSDSNLQIPSPSTNLLAQQQPSLFTQSSSIHGNTNTLHQSMPHQTSASIPNEGDARSILTRLTRLLTTSRLHPALDQLSTNHGQNSQSLKKISQKDQTSTF